jgi:hypothetical protein
MAEREGPVPPENSATSVAIAPTPSRRTLQKIVVHVSVWSFLAIVGAYGAEAAGLMAWAILRGGLVVLTQIEVGERPFDPAEWKRLGDSSTLRGRVVRQVMARDVIQERSLIGLSWDAASEILGPPDLERTFASDGSRAYCYRVGLPTQEEDCLVIFTYGAGIVDSASFRGVHADCMTSP